MVYLLKLSEWSDDDDDDDDIDQGGYRNISVYKVECSFYTHFLLFIYIQTTYFIFSLVCFKNCSVFYVYILMSYEYICTYICTYIVGFKRIIFSAEQKDGCYYI